MTSAVVFLIGLNLLLESIIQNRFFGFIVFRFFLFQNRGGFLGDERKVLGYAPMNNPLTSNEK
jgi:hypothetical protein